MMVVVESGIFSADVAPTNRGAADANCFGEYAASSCSAPTREDWEDDDNSSDMPFHSLETI
jgi:hypothetical protein